MKGIILAGGSGTRLYPLTLVVNKQLIPVYDKPMVYYPLSTLMRAGIREVLIISNPENLPYYKQLLGDGKRLGCSFSYAVQPKPEGLAQAFIIGENFIGDDNVCLILGDNIFYGHGLGEQLEKNQNPGGGIIMACYVSDPQRYGIVEFNKKREVISIVEKPEKPKSNYAVPGIYFYDNEVVSIAKKLKPSDRGELEITDVNKVYFKKGKLKVSALSMGTAWFDMGTIDSLMEAAEFVKVVQGRRGTKIGCIEEVAFEKGFINKRQLKDLARPLIKSEYGQYLMELAEGFGNL